MTHVRLATDADLDAAADTLALAQVDYAWAEWAFPYPDRLDRLRRSFALDVQLGFAWNSLWVTDDVRRIPVQIRSKYSFGEVTLVLDKMTLVPPGHPD